MTEILVVTEGATEREVGRVLYERRILSNQAAPKPPQWRSNFGSREGFDNVVKALKDSGTILSLRTSSNKERLLLVFDQEDAATPQDRAVLIGQELGLQFSPYQPQHYDNLFECNEPNLHVVLHVSSAEIPGINRRDFDGYILQLLQGQNKTSLASRLSSVQATAINNVLAKAEREIPDLMQRNGFPLTHAKSRLYAYITAFQFCQSHVWFARDVVQYADEQALRHVFASLIAAWDALI
ncbi:MAG: hypothetical protein RMJ55_17305 [Roseiflexaceae bacterium]|nr:hypothetical protein [Roseiflexus sp.]MDW8147301.1 hypothetical protein [Roseiflexaceae bacterium]MDW8215313.1 hypothetical protein [Roseiflexaceae bacterium]